MVTSGIFSPIFEPESIAILRQLYEWTVFDPSQFQEDKYILAKKLSEVSWLHMYETSDVAFANLLLS